MQTDSLPPVTGDLPHKKADIWIDRFSCMQNAAVDLLKSDRWVSHVNSANYDGEWQALPLRGLACNIDKHPILQAYQIEQTDDASAYTNYPVMDSLPGVAELLGQLNCDILSVRLMRLAQGANIKEHRDLGLCITNGQARLHLVLQSDDVSFTVAGEKLPMREGELWYINADKPHSVTNNGGLERIHLVIDCLANDALITMFGLPVAPNLLDLSLGERQQWLKDIASVLRESEQYAPGDLHRCVKSYAVGLAGILGLDLYPKTNTDSLATPTEFGRAIRPWAAAKCAEEYLRTTRFVHGIFDAAASLLQKREKIDVLYAGTGPFATLLLPLMAYMDSSNLCVDLLDIHRESLDQVDCLLKAFGLEDRAGQFICADASSWQSEGKTYDMIVSETMMAGLAHEPQVSVFANLVKYLADDGELIPQQIRISVSGTGESGTLIGLGDLPVLDRRSCEKLADGQYDALDAVVDMEQPISDLYLDTSIQVYGSRHLSGNECSLNQQLKMPLDNTPINCAKFTYLINQDPGYQLRSS